MSEQLTCCCPQVLATNPTLHDHHGSDDRLRTTVYHSFDPLGLGGGEMDLQFILGSFGHWQRGLWLRRLNNSPMCLPQVLATNPTLHDHHRPDDRLRTTVCHSFDPSSGGGEMDLQFILWSFGHWQEGLWLLDV
jgi:hypothetical protein